MIAGIEPSDNYRQFPINTFGERTERFYWLSEENRNFLTRFGNTMLQLSCIKSQFTRKAYGGLPAFTPDDTLIQAYNSKQINSPMPESPEFFANP